MATVNFSVPDEIKRDFNELFANENKSAVLTKLLRQAIEERRRQQRRAAAIDALLALRQDQPPATQEDIRRAREDTRK